MRNNKKLIAVAMCLSVGLASYKSYQDYKKSSDKNLLMQEVEALTDCDVTAQAKKGFVTIATASLVCKGKGTCQIPENEFGLTAVCSGKMITYELKVLGRKVN